MWNDLCAEIENLCQRAGLQAMIDIIPEPCLEDAGMVAIVQHAAAINEAFRHITDFRDVEMSGDLVAIGQRETRVG
jgi:hypothetical protein